MPARKRIALVAHDNLKVEMVAWCDRSRTSDYRWTEYTIAVNEPIIRKDSFIMVKKFEKYF